MRRPVGHRRGRARRGLGLIEATISVLLVGVMLVAALRAVGSSAVAQRIQADRARARLLAQSLLTEVTSKAYEDPTMSEGSWGLEPDEAIGAGRALMDDVDDFDGWTASPPVNRDGSVIPGFDGWRRTVSVAWVNPGDAFLDSATDTRLKRIVVTVERGDAEQARATALRSAAWDAANTPETK